MAVPRDRPCPCRSRYLSAGRWSWPLFVRARTSTRRSAARPGCSPCSPARPRISCLNASVFLGLWLPGNGPRPYLTRWCSSRRAFRWSTWTRSDVLRETPTCGAPREGVFYRPAESFGVAGDTAGNMARIPQHAGRRRAVQAFRRDAAGPPLHGDSPRASARQINQ